MRKYVLLISGANSEIHDIAWAAKLTMSLSKVFEVPSFTTIMSDYVFIFTINTDVPNELIRERFSDIPQLRKRKYLLIDTREEVLLYRINGIDDDEISVDLRFMSDQDMIFEIDGVWALTDTIPWFGVGKKPPMYVSEGTADEILDKIRATGIKSLTDTELKILKDRSKQISKNE